jgi:putative tryptophan/tyrosine transport system substrate-binding protein
MAAASRDAWRKCRRCKLGSGHMKKLTPSRRTVLGLPLLALHASVCIGQSSRAHIAFLSSASEKEVAATATYFRSIMSSVGLVEGNDYVVEFFCSDGHNERFPALAQAAVARKPAVIIATTVASALAAQKATGTIPIVITGVNDPVGTGLVRSYARPGGNITGTSSMADDFLGKLIELTREVIPGARRVAILVNPQNASNAPIFQTFERLARTVGVSAEALEISAPQQVDAALADLVRKRPDALVTGFDNSHTHYRFRFAQVASSQGIAIVSADFRYSDAGALITYSAHRAWFRMPAVYVQKILAGANPADLPVQQPASFELLVNTRVADSLKLKLPQSVLIRATKLIE